MQSIRDKTSGCGRRGLAPQVKAMQAPYDQQIRAVLTPGQYSKFFLAVGHLPIFGPATRLLFQPNSSSHASPPQ